jgi:hypothetical protein
MAKKNNQLAVIALVAILLVVGIFAITQITGETFYKPPQEKVGTVGQVTFEILPPETATPGGRVNFEIQK